MALLKGGQSMPATDEKTVITAEQYRVLQRPVELPTPQQVFDYEVETLVAKGLMTHDAADPFRKDLPVGLFLLVPAQPAELDLNYLMNLVGYKGKNGVNYLAVEHLTSVVDAPKVAHLMLDVEDGATRLNVRPSESRANIRHEGRSPYDVWRGIVHAVVFPEVLDHHYLDLVGSRWGGSACPTCTSARGSRGSTTTLGAMPIRGGVRRHAAVSGFLDPWSLGFLARFSKESRASFYFSTRFKILFFNL